VLARFPSRVVFIGGGPTVYAAYAPFIRHWDINRLPYNGEADRWFDPAWLVQAAIDLSVALCRKLLTAVRSHCRLSLSVWRQPA
jgi:hypothetical protein